MRTSIISLIVVVISVVSTPATAQVDGPLDYGYECSESGDVTCYGTYTGPLNGCPEAICIPYTWEEVSINWGSDNDGVTCEGRTRDVYSPHRDACPSFSVTSYDYWNEDGSAPGHGGGNYEEDLGLSIGLVVFGMYSRANGFLGGPGISFNYDTEGLDVSARIYIGGVNPSPTDWGQRDMYADYNGTAAMSGSMFTFAPHREPSGGFVPFAHIGAFANLGGELSGFNSFDLTAGLGIQYWIGDSFNIEAFTGLGLGQYAEVQIFGYNLGLGVGYDF